MSVIGFLFLVFISWIFYNLFVKLIWPVYKTTRQIKKQFKNMAEQREPQKPSPTPPAEAPKEKVGEYIEFEEVK